MTDKKIIRKEIERRIAEHRKCSFWPAEERVKELKELLSFIDSLEEESEWIRELRDKLSNSSEKELDETLEKYTTYNCDEEPVSKLEETKN